MAKIDLDKYYTPKEVSKYCIEKTFEILKDEEICEIIEPSAGNGSFSDQIENCIAYDIKPESENIIEQDFLALDLNYKKGRLFIGNPPFGIRSNLARKFLIKCANLGDYISFILPLTFGNKDEVYFQPHRYSFNLVYSEVLDSEYSGIQVKTCLCIFKKVKHDKIYKPNLYELDGIEIFECRNTFNVEECDFGICTWGQGGICKECFKIDDYVQTVWFRLKNKSLVEKVKNLMTDREFILNFLKPYNITVPRLSKTNIRKIIYENIPELRKKDNLELW